MPKFFIEVQWHYKSFDYTEIEVEADSMEEAQVKALAQAEAEGQTIGWLDGQIYHGEYSVNTDESYQEGERE